MGRLAAAGGEQFVDFGCADGVGQELSPQVKAASEGLKLELSRVRRSIADPFRQVAVAR